VAAVLRGDSQRAAVLEHAYCWRGGTAALIMLDGINCLLYRASSPLRLPAAFRVATSLRHHAVNLCLANYRNARG